METETQNQDNIRNKGAKIPAARTKCGHVLFVENHPKTADRAKCGFSAMAITNGHTELVQRVRPVLYAPTMIQTVTDILFKAKHTS